jgi:hypothetical protein
MTKEEEIFSFLQQKVFDPILNSPKASQRTKSGIRMTIYRLKQRNAVGMWNYFWSAIKGTPNSVGFAARLKKEGFVRFEEVFEEFRVKFDEKWLKTPKG